MKQKDLGLDLNLRRTRKQTLLDEMEQVMPWCELLALITPHAQVAKTGRPPFDLAMMLRIHCLQQWFGLSDLGAEEALFETSFYRDFVGISGTQRIPDRVSILRFRHLLEAHDLSPKILQVINAKLAAHGLLLKTGTVVDATLIAAPSSTKNKTGERDPEMHQTKKGNQWHFGMKAHIGVDAESGLVHTVLGTAANVNDVTQGQGCTARRHWRHSVEPVPCKPLRARFSGTDSIAAAIARPIMRCGLLQWFACEVTPVPGNTSHDGQAKDCLKRRFTAA